MGARILGAAVGFTLTAAVAVLTTTTVLWLTKQFRMTRELAGLNPPKGGPVQDVQQSIQPPSFERFPTLPGF